MSKTRIAVHKFTSCDGCQLALLNLEQELLILANRVEIIHFAEAGPVAPEAEVDLAIIEGSVSSAAEVDRIKAIRERAKILVTVGACANSGGIQALRNQHDHKAWLHKVYPMLESIDSLATSTPIAEHVRVDFQLWGCPINRRQIKALLHSVLLGVRPQDNAEKLCLECKRQLVVCQLVSAGVPCLGPVTRTGCGALCPSFGRDCYGCYGPAEAANKAALVNRFHGLGLLDDEIARRFALIHSNMSYSHHER